MQHIICTVEQQRCVYIGACDNIEILVYKYGEKGHAEIQITKHLTLIILHAIIVWTHAYSTVWVAVSTMQGTDILHKQM